MSIIIPVEKYWSRVQASRSNFNQIKNQIIVFNLFRIAKARKTNDIELVNQLFHRKFCLLGLEAFIVGSSPCSKSKWEIG